MIGFLIGLISIIKKDFKRGRNMEKAVVFIDKETGNQVTMLLEKLFILEETDTCIIPDSKRIHVTGIGGQTDFTVSNKNLDEIKSMLPKAKKI